ncbi:diacylglycerol kinase [Vibrio algivorus]|uniref:Diacylglycerol kinase n=1 Tax=Vibrio algivorus TaxID=1667024 RepID=A0A557NWU8_9VIBR|nr:diacylglycerol kinase [Vibrio algivorus]TVO32889.1 diacylglycerol kinase [Vibrio algivorus]GLT13591.1 diacylglycerol kinase [Vibrio algivorus]
MNEKVVVKRTGIMRIIFTLKHSFNGLKWMLKNEAAFQQELVLFIPLTVLACYLDISAVQSVCLILSMMFVLFAEMVNTAIEAVVDRVGLEYHTLSGVAKNVGSALVTLSIIMSAMVWGVIVYPLF